MSSVFGFSWRTRFTRVARRATPPLPGYCLSFSGKGSICEWVSFVWRIVISVSPEPGSKSGALMEDHGGRVNDRKRGDGTVAIAPPAREALRKLRRVIMVAAPLLPEMLLYQKQTGHHKWL